MVDLHLFDPSAYPCKWDECFICLCETWIGVRKSSDDCPVGDRCSYGTLNRKPCCSEESGFQLESIFAAY